MILYNPSFIDKSLPTINIGSAWVGLEKIIRPILKDFNIESKKALEIGVDYGYSLWHLSEIFDTVTGVDTFNGDIHAGFRTNQYETVLETFKDKKNVNIVKQSYEEYFSENKENFNLVHVDIVHTYKDTYNCGCLASETTNCVIFHDTESFSEVKQACVDVAKQKNFTFYNYPLYYGLGILIRK